MATAVTNPFSPAPISIPNGSGGTSNTDMSIIPYMRQNEIFFVAHNLSPHQNTHFFFEDVLVDRFVQVPSVIALDGLNKNTANQWTQGDAVYCNATHAFAEVITPSGATNLYVNENFISINVMPVGANTLGSTDYAVGDIVTQYLITTHAVGGLTFSGEVVFYSSADKVLVVTPLFGSLVANNSLDITANAYTSNANHVFYNQDASKNKICYAANVVTGNKFQNSTTISNITKKYNSRTASSNGYTHISGVANTTGNGYYTNATSNTIVLSSNASPSINGQYMYLTSGSGYGQVSQILSIASDNVTVRLANVLSPLPLSTTFYSAGPMQIDAYGIGAGIFQLPEADNMKFLTGQTVLTLTDKSVINDPTSTMRAQATYYSGLDIPTSSGGVPVITPKHVSTGSDPDILPQAVTDGRLYSGQTSLLDTSSAGVAPGQFDTTTLGSGQPQLHPLAQTFFSPPPKSTKTNYGITVTSVELWFSNKPVSPAPLLPVVVKLAEVENGIPTKKILATCIVQCSEIATINIAAGQIPDTSNISGYQANNTTSTKFTFADPVYLKPSTEYALIVYAESPYYDILTSEIGAADVASGSALRKVSKPPSVGNFFTSQNSSQWTPIQNIQMMFVLNKAAFSTSPVTWNFNVDAHDLAFTPYNDVLLTSSATTYPSTQLEYKIQPIIFDQGLSSFYSDPTLTRIYPGNEFKFGSDLSISTNNGKSRWLLGGNTNSMVLQVDMQTLDADVNPIFNSEHLGMVAGTFVINNGGIASPNYTIINPGVHFWYSNVSVYFVSNTNPILSGGIPTNSNVDPTIQLSDGISAAANVILNQIDGNLGYLYQLNIYNQGSGYVGTPTIVINEPSFTLPIVTANVISGNYVVNISSSAVNTASNTGALVIPYNGNCTFSYFSSNANTYSITNRVKDGSKTTFNIASQAYMSNTLAGYVTFVPANANVAAVGEDQRSGGNALCRYQTKQIALADGFDSGDLRVWVDGIIPIGTSVQVYYKVMSGTDTDSFSNKKWKIMTPIVNYYSPDQSTPVEIQYADGPLIGGVTPIGSVSYIEDGIQYPLGGKFKYFAIKLVLLAADPSVSPTVTGLRALAVPQG